MSARKAKAAAAPAGGDKRRMVMMLGLGLALVAFAATRLMGGGGEDPFGKLDGTVSQAGALAGDHGDHGDHGPSATETPEAGADLPLRDPFCPLAATAGGPPANCSTRLRHVVAEPITLVDVFIEEGMPHARVKVADKVTVLHTGEGTAGYTVDGFSGTCAEMSRNGVRHQLCAGDQWAGEPA